MRTTTTLLIAFICLNFSCQEKKDIRLFKITFFNANGIVLSDTIEKINWRDTLDLTFYRKHFNMPYYFPGKLIDKKYKDETLVVWQDSTKEKKFYSNWTFTYKFDSLSRVREYSYSGCFICNQFPYTYIIYYDSRNRPISMENRPMLEYEKKVDKNIMAKTPSNEYKFLYDRQNNIIEIQYYTQGKMIEQIKEI